jgi:hypothetical protein
LGHPAPRPPRDLVATPVILREVGPTVGLTVCGGRGRV